MERTSEEVLITKNSDQLPAESFSYDDVKRVWRMFAFEAKNKGNDTLYHAMIRREPHLIDDYIIKMELDNQVQLDYISPLTSDFLTYFRKELKNYQIDLELFITQENNTEVKYKSGKEKFAAFAKRNPSLHKMVEILNLEIEY